jgi:hypothetical protein
MQGLGARSRPFISAKSRQGEIAGGGVRKTAASSPVFAEFAGFCSRSINTGFAPGLGKFSIVTVR